MGKRLTESATGSKLTELRRATLTKVESASPLPLQANELTALSAQVEPTSTRALNSDQPLTVRLMSKFVGLPGWIGHPTGAELQKISQKHSYASVKLRVPV